MKANTPAHEMMKSVYDVALRRLDGAVETRLAKGVHIALSETGRLLVERSVQVQDVTSTTKISFDEGREGTPRVERVITGTDRPLSLVHGPREWPNIASDFQELLAETETEVVIDLRTPDNAIISSE